MQFKRKYILIQAVFNIFFLAFKNYFYFLLVNANRFAALESSSSAKYVLKYVTELGKLHEE